MSAVVWTQEDKDRLVADLEKQRIVIRHEEICEELTGVKSKLLTYEAMYQILEQIRKEHGFEKGDIDRQKTAINELRAKQRKLKKELFLFRLKHGMKHD